MNFLASRKIFNQSRLRKPARVMLFLTVLFLFCGFSLLIYEARFIYLKTEKNLEKECQNQFMLESIPFEILSLTPHINQNIQIIQSAKDTRTLAKFQKSVFAATAGGLLKLSENGEVLQHFTVLDGLPESDLTSLAVFQSKLFIGTKSKGLISFDGEKFAQFRLKNHETKSITGLFPDRQRLLIGTFSGGLLEFDGAKIREIKAVDERLEHITFIKQNQTDLLVGTFSDGLWLRRNQIWKQFTNADGLPSNRVIDAEISDGNLFSATDLGVAQMLENTDTFRKVFDLPTISSFAKNNGEFLLTKDSGEIFSFSSKELQKISWKQPQNLNSAKLFLLEDELFFLSSQGILKNKSFDKNELSFVQFSKTDSENELSDNNISAVSIDENDRIWLGTFRNGIDVFSSNGDKIKHLESENVREINFLTQSFNKQITAATSSGAIIFNAAFNKSSLLENLPIPSNSVSQISFYGDDNDRFSAIATSKGLIVTNSKSSRIFSTINGLPSNSVFSTLYTNNSLFVGTMSGLAQIENGKVARVFKTSNSELKNNWISAFCLSEKRIFIGTYGGGIYELLPSGEIRAFADETGKSFVNPNAMFSDGERLYAGTLQGALVLDLTTQKWSRLREVLPSETVLSISGNRDSVFFGTTNGVAKISKKYWSEN